jgi:hypothetical protein
MEHILNLQLCLLNSLSVIAMNVSHCAFMLKHSLLYGEGKSEVEFSMQYKLNQ